MICISQLFHEYVHKNLRFEKLEAMYGHQNIAIGIHFEKITVKGIEPQTSDREARIIFKFFELFGISQAYQSLND